MVDIIGYSYIDKKGRNNVQKAEGLDQSVQKTYSVSALGEMLRSQLVYEFMVNYEKYGVNATIEESIINNNESELLPKNFKIYLMASRSEQQSKEKVRTALTAALMTMKQGQKLRKSGKLFNSMRNDTPKNLELALLLLLGGTLRVRSACHALNKEKQDASEVAKLELGDIEFHERKDGPVSNQFSTKQATATNAEPEPMQSIKVDGPGARTFSKVCSALFDGKNYDGEIMMEKIGSIATTTKTKKGGKKRNKEATQKIARKKSKTTDDKNENDDLMDVEEGRGQQNQNEIEDQHTVKVSVNPDEIVGTVGDDEEDKMFVCKQLADLGIDVSTLCEEKQLSLVSRLRDHFSVVPVDGNENYGQEQRYYDEHLPNMVLGDYRSEITTMKQVLLLAYRNAKIRSVSQYDRTSRGKGFTTAERDNCKEWDEFCASEDASVREKVIKFSALLDIQVHLISALGSDWTTEVLGRSTGVLPAMTILAKTGNGELQNDLTTTYFYYVPEDPGM
eukprot:scaffold4139_cov72-Skeletonema_menzelii.AAC.2